MRIEDNSRLPYRERQFHYTEYITPCTLAAKPAKSSSAEAEGIHPRY
jgi:hypothetical protein